MITKKTRNCTKTSSISQSPTPVLKIIKARFLKQLKVELDFEKFVGFALLNRWEGAESHPRYMDQNAVGSG